MSSGDSTGPTGVGTDDEKRLAPKLGVSLTGLGPEDEAIAQYLGISLLELAEVNARFGNRLTKTEATEMRSNIGWPRTRQAIANGHRARLVGWRVRQAAPLVVILVLGIAGARCAGWMG
jgi:hypothetical protein